MTTKLPGLVHNSLDKLAELRDRLFSKYHVARASLNLEPFFSLINGLAVFTNNLKNVIKSLFILERISVAKV